MAVLTKEVHIKLAKRNLGKAIICHQIIKKVVDPRDEVKWIRNFLTRWHQLWEMILIVHGFPNDVIALQFEWAWQNPQRTRRLKYTPFVKNKKTKESHVSFSFRILSELLRIGPWNRLPLTIRWLIQEYKMEFDPCRQPPLHMPVAYGPLITDNQKKKKINEDDDLHIPMYQSKRCAKCSAKLKSEEPSVHCPKPGCTMVGHTICLAKAFIRHNNEDGIFCLPLEGKCPGCEEDLLWRDLVKSSEVIIQLDDEDEQHWTENLRQESYI